MPEAKGAMIGFGDVHTRAHMYRAIIEGIGYDLLQGVEQIEHKSGKKATRVMVSGGGSQSDAICQITADMFNRPAPEARPTRLQAWVPPLMASSGLESIRLMKRLFRRWFTGTARFFRDLKLLACIKSSMNECTNISTPRSAPCTARFRG